MGTRIVLIHAVSVAMQPVQDAFARGWPEAETVNLLEDSLSPDLEAAGELTRSLMNRIAALARYGIDIGARGILFTCSAFGEAIDAAAAAVEIPVLKPNEAMFGEALEAGDRIGLLATFQPSVPSMEKEFFKMADDRGKTVKLESLWVQGAMDALKSGDGDTHDRLLAQAASNLSSCDAVMLAHFSTARALRSVSRAIDCAVLTSPDSAVGKLKSIID
ncbi:MAG: arylsulfatase [Proteobacteria bacterium]|nr:arylsulfatase [Pseudomonadota bacterium]